MKKTPERKEAERQAYEKLAATGKPQAIWLVGPGGYAITAYEPGDEKRQLFVCAVQNGAI